MISKQLLNSKTLIKGIVFLVFIFFFAWVAIVEYKQHKAKLTDADKK